MEPKKLLRALRKVTSAIWKRILIRLRTEGQWQEPKELAAGTETSVRESPVEGTKYVIKVPVGSSLTRPTPPTPVEKINQERFNQVTRVLKKLYDAGVLQHPNLDHPEVVGKKVILARRMLGDLFDLRLYPRSAIPFTAIECYKVALQIVEAIFHLHSQNVVHKDLKAENTLLDDHKNVMVTDFGFTFWPAPGKEPNYDNGTPVYLPPEILSRFVAKKSYSASELSAIDNPIDFFKQGEIWSLGLILYELFQGDPLLDALGVRALPDSFTHKIFQLHETFSSLDIQQSINTAIKGLISKISPGGEELSRLLQWMLRVAPGERPTIDQVRANLTRLTPTMDLENPAAAPATASVREVKQPELPSWMRSEKLSGDSPVYRALIHLYQALQYAQANPQISPRTHLEHINEALACLTQALAEEPSMNRLKKRVGKNARTLLAYMTDTVQEYRADLAAAVQAEAAAAGPAPL